MGGESFEPANEAGSSAQPSVRAASPTRRAVLTAAGAGALAAIGGGSWWATHRDADSVGTPGGPGGRLTVSAWRSSRKAPYFIAHRGAGTTVPEHTLPSYQQALDWGAQVIELSVNRTSDGTLICLHDLTYDRTTTITGRVSAQPASVLDNAYVSVPRLGPAWQGDKRPRVPKLSEALDLIAGRAVICIEAKDDGAYEPMIQMLRDKGLLDTAIIKVHFTSRRLADAKAAKLPVFAYIGNSQTATKANIDALAAKLDPQTDCLVLPVLTDDGKDMPVPIVEHAVATKVPVWLFPVHRRFHLTRYAEMGVQGFITPSLAYLSGAQAPLAADEWSSGAIPLGEMTKDPYSDAYRMQWGVTRARTYDVKGAPAFLTLGEFAPVATGRDTYRIEFQVRFEKLPSHKDQHISIAFGHETDRYYEHQGGLTDGYHAIIRADGRIGLFVHEKWKKVGDPLVAELQAQPLNAGEWIALALDVNPDGIRWGRVDGAVVESSDRRFRGRYLHIGRSGPDGPFSVKDWHVITA